MSKLLIDRIRKNREFKKAITDAATGRVFTLTCRRPTAQEISELTLNDIGCPLAQRFVVDWEGVVENDVIGGGGSDAIKFDALLWREWCADRVDFWGFCPKHPGGKDNDDCQDCNPLPKAILGAYTTYRETMEAAAKNLLPGSNSAT